ncbi:Putative SH3 domain protein (Fragment) [Aspergillus calidoustus]|uniref:Putative SH3 domain protein n=1 Tax=Aspergillus calidoustus TaxID=454130 RepID=A0A0U5GVS2_ASPCI
MSRPRIVRADTLDLQDHNAPSAKDHSKHAVQTSEGTGLAPHQEQEIRHADHDSKAEMMHGPNGHGTHLDTDGYQDGIEIYDGTDDIHVGLAAHRDESEIRGRAEEGGLSDEEDDDDLLDDDLMDKISSSPSINDDDDINFEFVYALHNFVATVDGQANAAKGDNMVLLDDSNSYWWLVRIVKDGSIGRFRYRTARTELIGNRISAC